MKRVRAAGFTLIELMVALLIGSFLTIALMSLMVGFEGQRRTLGAVAGLDQSGGIAMFRLDQWVRGAGTGFESAASYTYGCELFAAKGGTTLLPAGSALPAPFDGLSTTFRLAPVLIVPGGNVPSVSGQPSDILVTMASGAHGGGVATAFSASAGSGQLSLETTLPFAPGDLVLVTDQQPGSGGGPAGCLVTQVASSWSPPSTATPVVPVLTLAGSWYASTVSSTSLSQYSASGAAIDLGDPSGASPPPSFLAIGVGDNDTLFTYDLLGIATPALQAAADNVFELHARYGVDSDGDGIIDTWVDPGSSNAGGYTVASLMDGTPAANQRLQSIKAVRVGLILRDTLADKASATPTRLPEVTLFKDLGTLAYTRTFSASEQAYHYRTVEATIPVRNNLL